MRRCTFVLSGVVLAAALTGCLDSMKLTATDEKITERAVVAPKKNLFGVTGMAQLTMYDEETSAVFGAFGELFFAKDPFPMTDQGGTASGLLIMPGIMVMTNDYFGGVMTILSANYFKTNFKPGTNTGFGWYAGLAIVTFTITIEVAYFDPGPPPTVLTREKDDTLTLPMPWFGVNYFKFNPAKETYSKVTGMINVGEDTLTLGGGYTYFF